VKKMHDLENVLAEHPFLAGLSPEQLATVSGCASNVRFEPGQLLFKEGEDASEFYILRHGKVAIEAFSPTRGALTIQTIGEGEILGWSWLVPPYRWRFDARALELTRAIALDGKCLRGKCERDHDLGYELLKRFADVIGQRQDATRVQLLDLYDTAPPATRK
jgi:CRP/FNR family cyclic AMP-dependent transcriptional regulator